MPSNCGKNIDDDADVKILYGGNKGSIIFEINAI